jgi:lipase chaperone LimK
MNNKGQETNRESMFRELLDGYLRSGASGRDFGEIEHLDEDVITAFIEGNLSEKEAGPITTHLVDCNFCRHKTAELVRLDLQFAEDKLDAATPAAQPVKVADVLSGILGRIFGSAEGAVFAHEEKAEETKDSGEEEE